MADLFAYLSYRDAAAGIAWLEALGFETTTRQDGEDGAVAHAELRRGEAVVMLATADGPYEIPPLHGRSTGGGIYLLADEVEALHDAAVAAGGTSVFATEQTEWGTKRARVLDPEGYEWSFGSYEPGGSW
jgi:uncharacterized glyoxalase superfamily protein PhnB